MSRYKNSDKQTEAIKLFTSKKFNTYGCIGGSRSGKTWIILRALFIRALKEPNSNHLIIRKTYKDCRQKIGLQTIPELIEKCFKNVNIEINKSDWYILFPNGSRIWLGGLDSDNNRGDKILGTQYSTIFVNEATEITYESLNLAKTRLSEKNNLRKIVFIDFNPVTKSHWLYKFFELKIDPITNTPIDYCSYINMNPIDNVENIDENYLETLKQLPQRQRIRFLEGKWQDDEEGKLFKLDWINKNRVNQLPEMRYIVTAVDPAISTNKTSCETGIVTVGLDENEHFYVISDNSGIYTPDEWTSHAINTYNIYQANYLIAEVNQGGDLVTNAILSKDKSIKIQTVRATRGKAIRAEPISGLYERGFIHHYGILDKLEDELLCFGIDDSARNDRLDACVWACTYLLERCVRNRLPKIICVDDNKPVSNEEIITKRNESIKWMKENMLEEDEIWEEL